MSEPPKLEYASPPPDEPAKGGRVALGAAGAIAYGILILPFFLMLIATVTTRRVPPIEVFIVPGMVAAFCAWRFAAAVRHLWGGLGRRRRG
jgi:hypothetical protein